MKKIEYSGEFNLPNRNIKYPGRIVGSEDSYKLILEIFGDESIEGKKMIKNNPVEIDYYHQIILGHSFSPQNLTLLDCHWHGTEVIGENLYQIKYSIRIIFKHVLIKDYNNFKLNTLTICLPYLSTWYDGWKSLDKVDDLTEQEYQKVQSLEVNNELTLNFIDYLSKSPKVLGKSYEVNYQKYLQFTYKIPTHLDDIISDITKFRKLFEFSTLKRIHFKLIDATIENVHVSARDMNHGNEIFTVVRFDNYSFTQRQDVHKFYRHQNFLLLSRWKLDKEKLDSLIINWFSNSEYYHIYDFYLDSHNWFEGTEANLSNVMFNNRCLNLIQALEDYHRKTYDHLLPDIDTFNKMKSEVLKLLDSKKELKQWANNRINFNKVPYLNERLNDLIEKSKDIIKGLFGDELFYSEFPELAKKYRDMLSHGNMKGTSLGKELHYLFHSAQVLLAIIILSSIKLENIEILKLIKANVEFQRIIYEIRLYKARP